MHFFRVFVINFSALLDEKTTFLKTVPKSWLFVWLLSNKAGLLRAQIFLERCWRHNFLFIHRGGHKWRHSDDFWKGFRLSSYTIKGLNKDHSLVLTLFSHMNEFFLKYGARTLVPFGLFLRTDHQRAAVDVMFRVCLFFYTTDVYTAREATLAFRNATSTCHFNIFLSSRLFQPVALFPSSLIVGASSINFSATSLQFLSK